MMIEDKRSQEEKIQDLIYFLNYHTKLYDEGHPQLTDEEWDDYYFDLVKLENETSIYLKDSPTQKVNYNVVNQLEKVTHNHLMLSLDKTKSIEEVQLFINKKEHIAMAKMDRTYLFIKI